MKQRMKKWIKSLPYGYFLALAVSIVVALLVGAVFLLCSGKDPLEGYAALVRGAFGSKRLFGNTLAQAMLLCLLGLATAVGSRAGIFNVGGEGQLWLGGAASVAVALALKGTSAWLVVPLAVLAAVAAGGAYAFVPGILKVKWKVNEVITTLMLNSAAIYFCYYLVNGPMRASGNTTKIATETVDAAYRYTRLIKLSDLYSTILYAAVLAFLVWYVMEKTSIGFEMRMTGENPRFAFFSGMKRDRITLWSMVASGCICGLVGMFLVFGKNGAFTQTHSVELYFDGMMVAMIMRYQPLGIIVMSLFFGALDVGALEMQNVGIASEIVLVIKSLIFFFMAAENGILRSVRARAAQKEAKKAILERTGKEAIHG